MDDAAADGTMTVTARADGREDQAVEADRERPAGVDPERVTAGTPRPVLRPVMTQRWTDLTYLHWPVDPALLEPTMPPGTRVDTAGGAAWVGLIPFVMRDVRLRVPGTARPALRPPPPLGAFCETNVRTYSVGPDGRRGVVFLSLDAERALPVLVARTVFALPYLWSRMRCERDGDLLTYTCERRVPGPRGTRSRLTVRPGAPVEPTALDLFLTARWGLHVRRGRRTAYGPMDHGPWPLHSAELLDLDDDLVAAAGLPRPAGPPRVLFSPGVDVRVGWLERTV